MRVVYVHTPSYLAREQERMWNSIPDPALQPYKVGAHPPRRRSRRDKEIDDRRRRQGQTWSKH